MTIYICWNRAQDAQIKAAYLQETGEALSDSRPAAVHGMTGSGRITSAQQSALRAQFGSDISFSETPPEGWELV